MAFTLKRRLYERLPSALKAPVGWVPFAWVAGKAYRETMRRCAEVDKASREEVVGAQEKALGDMLRFACREVPAYESFKGVVEKYRPFDALKEFRLLDKETIQEDRDRFLPRSVGQIPHYECTTGGTSGRQLKFYVDDSSQAVETAFMHHQWARVGYDPRCRKATFRGVEFQGLREGVYWQPNPVYNELQFSPYHMNPKTLGSYVEQIMAYQPSFLHGYPSALSILADYALRNEVSFERLSLRAVLLGSESLFPDQREVIERAFGARVYSWYGHSERLILAGECEESTAYHHVPRYGVLEIVGESGSEVQEGEKGELVGTGLLNRSMPLIRYRTGDRARKLPPTCACGRRHDRFDQVEGRWKQEFVIGRNGSRISVAALNIHGAALDNVVRYQYVQKEPGKMEVRVMVGDTFSADDESAIRHAFASKTGDELDVTVTRVEDIPLTERGKLLRLVQNIEMGADA